MNYIKVKELKDIDSLKSIRGKKRKMLFTSILSELARIHFEDLDSVETDLRPEILHKNLEEYMDFVFSPMCDACGTTLYICKNCRTIDPLKINPTKGSLECAVCGKDFNFVENSGTCINGHELIGDLNENTYAYLNKRGAIVLRRLLRELKLDFEFEPYQIEFTRGQIGFYRPKMKIYYTLEEMPIFKDITDLPPEKKEEYLEGIKNVGERCNKKEYVKRDCVDCLTFPPDYSRICVQRLVVDVTGGEIRKHSPTEYGDFNFPLEIAEQGYLVYGIAKGGRANRGHALTLKNNDRLLPQFIQALYLRNVHVICVAVATNIDAELREVLIDLAAKEQKRVIFIERPGMMKLLYSYHEKVEIKAS